MGQCWVSDFRELPPETSLNAPLYKLQRRCDVKLEAGPSSETALRASEKTQRVQRAVLEAKRSMHWEALCEPCVHTHIYMYMCIYRVFLSPKPLR